MVRLIRFARRMHCQISEQPTHCERGVFLLPPSLDFLLQCLCSCTDLLQYPLAGSKGFSLNKRIGRWSHLGTLWIVWYILCQSTNTIFFIIFEAPHTQLDGKRKHCCRDPHPNAMQCRTAQHAAVASAVVVISTKFGVAGAVYNVVICSIARLHNGLKVETICSHEGHPL